MEQRVSGLQARLEARRNMFLKTDNNGPNNATYGVNNGNKQANTNSTSLGVSIDQNYSESSNGRYEGLNLVVKVSKRGLKNAKDSHKWAQ